MAQTHTLIASAIMNGSTATYTFSSIPQTYTDLVLVMSGLNTGNCDVYPNGSKTTTNYGYTQFYINSLNLGQQTGNNTGSLCTVNGGYSCLGYGVLNIANYTSTTISKLGLSKTIYQNTSGGNTPNIFFGAAVYTPTTAITSLLLDGGAVSFPTTTTFSLYGIKAA